jgi:hypothetical protein
MGVLAKIGIYALLASVAYLLWIFYRFFVRIHLAARRFQKMDPSLKLIIGPISGLAKTEKQSL